MTNSVALPVLMEDEIDALVTAGYYSSKSEVIKDAVRTLLETKSNLKLAASLEMYKKGRISIGRAADLAGIGLIEFKELLSVKGVEREMSVDYKDMKNSDQLIEKILRHGYNR